MSADILIRPPEATSTHLSSCGQPICRCFFPLFQEEMGISCELLESDFLKCSVGFPFMRSKSKVRGRDGALPWERPPRPSHQPLTPPAASLEVSFCRSWGGCGRVWLRSHPRQSAPSKLQRSRGPVVLVSAPHDMSQPQEMQHGLSTWASGIGWPSRNVFFWDVACHFESLRL